MIMLIVWLAFCADLLVESGTWKPGAASPSARSGQWGLPRMAFQPVRLPHGEHDGALTVRNRFSRWRSPFSDIADTTWLPGRVPLLKLRSGLRYDWTPAQVGLPGSPVGR